MSMRPAVCLGMPVIGVVADATGDPDRAVEEATRLVDEEGVHAIVGTECELRRPAHR